MMKRQLFVLAAALAAVALVVAGCASFGGSGRTVRAQSYGHNPGPVKVEVTVDTEGAITAVKYTPNDSGWPQSYFGKVGNAGGESPGFVLRLLEPNYPSNNTLENLNARDKNDGIPFGLVMVEKQSFYLQRGTDVVAGATASLWAFMTAAQEAYSKAGNAIPVTGFRPVQASQMSGDARIIVSLLADENGTIGNDGYARINGWEGEGDRPSLNAAMSKVLADKAIDEAGILALATGNTSPEFLQAFIDATKEAIAKAR